MEARHVQAHEHGQPEAAGDDEPVVLSGYVLRCFLVVTLRDEGAALTVSELVTALARRRCATPGRASKDVSDALRWEVGRGRVRRIARATYAVGRLPRQTAWRMRRRLAELSI